jgi:ABC-type transport system involved in multi-copper enzyme maturation permease subunit
MVGPVLHQEMLLGGRRYRLHLLRWLYAGWLIFQVIFFWLAFQAEESTLANKYMRANGQEVWNVASAPEVIGARFAETYLSQQMLLLLLITPAFVAGAVTDEKRRGTMQYLLTTDLESRHIILGKLVGRLAQVFLVLLAGLPLFALLAGFGGVTPITIAFSVLVLVLPVFGLAAGALLASVWCRQTRDAVLAFYLVCVAVGLLVYRVGGVFLYIDPLYVLNPAWGAAGSLDLAEASRRLIISSIIWGVVGGVCAALAAARLRPAYIRELESIRPERLDWSAADREPIDDEPVRWRERNVEGLAPNPTLRRVPQWLAILLIATLTTASSLYILYRSIPAGVSGDDVLRALLQLNVRKVAVLLQDATTGFLIQAVVVMLIASLIVGIRCSGAVTSEREKQTWEAVLLTPLSAKQIIRGKMWGIMGASYWYLLAYAAPAVTLSVFGGPLALGYTVVWLASTVLAMYFIGAAGLWCSVKAVNSWRSLLHTLVAGYLGGLMIYTVTSPLIFILAGILLIFLLFVDWMVGTTLAGLAFRNGPMFMRVFAYSSSIGLAVIFWVMARIFLARAQRWVADRERTRHWYDEPFYRRSRPRESLPRVGY